MLVTLVSWLITALLAGMAGILVLRRHFRPAPDTCIAAGLALLTVYAELWNFFAGVGAAAFFAAAGAVLILFFLSGHFNRAGRSIHSNHSDRQGSGGQPHIAKPDEAERSDAPAVFDRSNGTANRAGCGGKACKWIRLMISALVFLLILAISALQPSSYDDYLYHAQALRWTEQFRVVPGLANLHSRLGYNSSFFPLQALLGFGFLRNILPVSFVPPEHALNGFLTAAILVYCVRTIRIRGARTSDFIKAATILYFSGMTMFLSGLDTDPPAMAGIAYLFIKWAELIESHGKVNKEGRGAEYSVAAGKAGDASMSDGSTLAGHPGSLVSLHIVGSADNDSIAGFLLLSVFAVFLCTVKLSAAPVVLLPLFTLIKLIRKQNGRGIALGFAGSAVVVLPFLIRNVILSGRLLYPSTVFDFFPVDWKIPADIARGDADGIRIWGRGLSGLLYEGHTFAELAAMPVAKWFPYFLRSLSTTDKFLLVLDVVLILLTVFFAVVWLIRYIRTKACSAGNEVGVMLFSGYHLFLLVCTAFFCLLFWLFTSPDERYGAFYLMLAAAAGTGFLVEWCAERCAKSECNEKRECKEESGCKEKSVCEPAKSTLFIRNRAWKIVITCAFYLVFTALLLLRVVHLPAWTPLWYQLGYALVCPKDFAVSENLAPVEIAVKAAAPEGDPGDYSEAQDENTTGDGNFIQSVTIWVPEDGGDRTDFAHFPSAPAAANLDGIELRGGSLQDGFRAK